MAFETVEETGGQQHTGGEGRVAEQVQEGTGRKDFPGESPSHGVCVIGDLGKLVWEFDSDLVTVYRDDGSVHEHRVRAAHNPEPSRSTSSEPFPLRQTFSFW